MNWLTQLHDACRDDEVAATRQWLFATNLALWFVVFGVTAISSLEVASIQIDIDNLSQFKPWLTIVVMSLIGRYWIMIWAVTGANWVDNDLRDPSIAEASEHHRVSRIGPKAIRLFIDVIALPCATAVPLLLDW